MTEEGIVWPWKVSKVCLKRGEFFQIEISDNSKKNPKSLRRGSSPLILFFLKNVNLFFRILKYF